ncbi:MAG TPA: SgcJ/EcaC family oxidoreductase [Pirellulales bacterium]|nr:SgcJ/EcaC family oxidoreductase [Pirellulales bacterium]
MTRKVFLPIALLMLPGGFSTADDGPKDEDVRQIEAEAAAYVEAFNAKDAAALARHWSENGVYVRPADGIRLVGRKAIEKQFQTSFADDPEAVLAVKVDTVRFVTDDVAIEEGTAEVTSLPNTLPSRTGYSAVHVKRDGQWQIDSIRETDLPAPEEPANERLAELAWLVGDWVDQSEEATVETSVVWTKNKTFLSYTFKISTGNVDELEGTQVVGYDPLLKAVRSWMFDSDGGFGDGLWSRDDNRWLVKFRQVLADGRTASSTNVYTYVDADTFTWQSIDREVDGQALSNVEPVTLVRKRAADSDVESK